MHTEKKNLWLFFAGNLMSLFGSAIYTFALGLYVLKLTGSGLSFAMNLVMGILPVILINPFAGVIADRFDKKRTVVLMDTLSGILMLSLFLVTRETVLTLPLIYLSTFVLTSLTQILGVTFEAAKPNLVGKEIPVVRINSLGQMVYGMTAILGPVAGGMIFAFVDIRLFILVNGISFGISAISECFIDFGFNRSTRAQEASKGVFTEIKEGVNYLLKRKDLMDYMALFIIGNFFISVTISVGLPYLINVEMGLPSSVYGLIQGTFPIGLIAGALFVEKISSRVSLKRLFFISMMVIAVMVTLMGIPPFFTTGRESVIIGYMIAIAIIIGVAITFIDVPTMTYMQTEVEEKYRGRVMSIRISLVKIVNPIAFILSGMVIGRIPSSFLMIGSGIFFIIYLLISKRDFFKETSEEKISQIS